MSVMSETRAYQTGVPWPRWADAEPTLGTIEIASGDRAGHLGDRADLPGQVPGQLVHVLGQPLPGAGHALDLGLAA